MGVFGRGPGKNRVGVVDYCWFIQPSSCDLKVVREGEQVMWVGNLFHILMAEGKKECWWVLVQE